MATITLEYNYNDIQAQKTLEYILSLGLFKPANTGKEETVSEKRKKLDDELKNYMVDLSDFKFDREEANVYE
jgi:hypothetical protein